MVMTHLPAFHVWKFLMKNMTPTNSGLGDRCLARSQAAFSDACIINRRWCTVLSIIVSISINRVHTRLL